MPNNTCSWCGERVTGPSPAALHPYHYECLFRSIMGSLAHLQGRCSCFVLGSSENDPKGMSLREGAQAAFDYWNSLDEAQHLAIGDRPRIRHRARAMG